MPLPLPISPSDAIRRVIEPALDLLPSTMGSDEALVMLVAIALQESNLDAREQDGGPARGLWQFERGTKASHGGAWGVLEHPATRDAARTLCAARGCPATAGSVYLALAGDDILAAGIARLLLWTDPHPLPALGDAEAAWDLYAKRTWRPGKPRRQTWPRHYETALRAVTARTR